MGCDNAGAKSPNEQKFFASFFQKRSAFFLIFSEIGHGAPRGLGVTTGATCVAVQHDYIPSNGLAVIAPDVRDALQP